LKAAKCRSETYFPYNSFRTCLNSKFSKSADKN
jgi:hypothetical protein